MAGPGETAGTDAGLVGVENTIRSNFCLILRVGCSSRKYEASAATATRATFTGNSEHGRCGVPVEKDLLPQIKGIADHSYRN